MRASPLPSHGQSHCTLHNFAMGHKSWSYIFSRGTVWAHDLLVVNLTLLEWKRWMAFSVSWIKGGGSWSFKWGGLDADKHSTKNIALESVTSNLWHKKCLIVKWHWKITVDINDMKNKIYSFTYSATLISPPLSSFHELIGLDPTLITACPLQWIPFQAKFPMSRPR